MSQAAQNSCSDRPGESHLGAWAAQIATGLTSTLGTDQAYWLQATNGLPTVAIRSGACQLTLTLHQNCFGHTGAEHDRLVAVIRSRTQGKTTGRVIRRAWRGYRFDHYAVWRDEEEGWEVRVERFPALLLDALRAEIEFSGG